MLLSNRSVKIEIYNTVSPTDPAICETLIKQLKVPLGFTNLLKILQKLILLTLIIMLIEHLFKILICIISVELFHSDKQVLIFTTSVCYLCQSSPKFEF